MWTFSSVSTKQMFPVVFSTSKLFNMAIIASEISSPENMGKKQESPPARERKRHTTRRVASHAELVWWEGRYPLPGGGTPWGNPTWTWDGVPPCLDLRLGTPLPGPGMGYPPAWTWEGGTPCLDLGWGTPCQLDGVTPPQVWTDTQTENITSPHPSDAGGKNYTSENTHQKQINLS